MNAMANVPFKDLETRGFVLIPSFLPADEVESFRQDHANQPAGGNENYSVRNASAAANVRLAARVSEALLQVSAQTNLRVDVPHGGAYFATGVRTGINFPWHQDHESFFILQNHYDYLNFYIPIVKPRADKSNLSIVPFDELEKASPRSFRALVRGGATRFVQMLGMRLVILDDSGRIHRLGVDLDRIAQTPKLSAGDCLLLRGDVIHRTQDTETERVAISFRASSTQARISRARLAAGSLEKVRMMANNSRSYERIFAAFDAAGKGELTMNELNAAIPGLNVQRRGRRAFVKYLFRQKLRAGVLSRFLVSVAATSAVDLVTRASKSYDRRIGARA